MPLQVASTEGSSVISAAFQQKDSLVAFWLELSLVMLRRLIEAKLSKQANGPIVRCLEYGDDLLNAVVFNKLIEHSSEGSRRDPPAPESACELISDVGVTL